MITLQVEWRGSGRKAQCAPDPNYPDGKDVDATKDGEDGMWVEVPYPAPECGVWIIHGEGIRNTAVTAAGRPDDPRNVKVAYDKEKNNGN